ncbi:MAG: glycosyltransferase [Comamonadaceae bacterium]|nr:MAG: glycosyltransferase [Comamonadaceae bacterium]
MADYGVAPERIAVVIPGTDRPSAPLQRTPGVEAGSDPHAEPGAKTDSEAGSATGTRTGTQGLRLLCVATVTPRKGHAVLLQALAGLRERAWHLHCIGSLQRDAATAAAAQAATESLGLTQRVSWHGEFDGEPLAAHYAQADVFVLASYYEGYGMVLSEALANGLPVVSCAAGAIVDTVPADAGVLVPPGDADALRAVLARLMDDAAHRAKLAAGAQRAAASLPSWRDSALAFEATLLRAMDAPPP